LIHLIHSFNTFHKPFNQINSFIEHFDINCSKKKKQLKKKTESQSDLKTKQTSMINKTSQT